MWSVGEGSERGYEIAAASCGVGPGALVPAALVAQPDVLETIRDGNVRGAVTIIGAVMKGTDGQADVTRKPVLEQAVV